MRLVKVRNRLNELFPFKLASTKEKFPFGRVIGNDPRFPRRKSRILQSGDIWPAREIYLEFLTHPGSATTLSIVAIQINAVIPIVTPKNRQDCAHLVSESSSPLLFWPSG